MAFPRIPDVGAMSLIRPAPALTLALACLRRSHHRARRRKGRCRRAGDIPELRRRRPAPLGRSAPAKPAGPRHRRVPVPAAGRLARGAGGRCELRLHQGDRRRRRHRPDVRHALEGRAAAAFRRAGITSGITARRASIRRAISSGRCRGQGARCPRCWTSNGRRPRPPARAARRRTSFCVKHRPSSRRSARITASSRWSM